MMDWCKKCCPLSFCQQQEVRSVKYDEPSHHFEKTVFKFPQTMESRPPFPPMFQGRQATKRLNSPHVKKMSQIVLDQPRLPLESRFISRQRYVMEPLLPLEDKLLSWQSTRRQSQNDSVEGILESPVYAKTVAQFTGNKLSSQHRIDLSSFGCRKPSLQFSLEYDMVHSVLSVHLMAAFNLPAMDICGTSDPYVEITLYPNHDKAKSKIIEKCLDPNFDEKFTFKNVYQCDINNMILQFFVYDFDKLTKDDKIGSVSVTLEEANLAGELMLYEIDMHTKAKKVDNHGTILLCLSYDDYFNSLKGTVVKLGNLARKDIITGKSDPYVKVKLLCQGKRLRKWKSTTKVNNLNPQFNESFQFDLQDQSINNCQLCITVLDRDHIKQDDVIGRVCIGADVAQTDARKHWEEMLVSPQEVSRWHPLLPIN